MTLSKTGTNVEHRIWVAEGLFYMANNERFDNNVSKADLKGDHRTNNKVVCDLCLLYTSDAADE